MEGYPTIYGLLTTGFLDVEVAASFTGRVVTWSETEKKSRDS
jgi:hypothetical protein